MKYKIFATPAQQGRLKYLISIKLNRYVIPQCKWKELPLSNKLKVIAILGREISYLRKKEYLC